MSLEWPLVGRADELNLVERMLGGRVAAGVVLAGPAGVGKTRLARELLARATAMGQSTAWVQATQSARAITFGGFSHLLPADLGEVGAVNVLRLAGDAITGRSADSSLVLGVDDAHLLDASSAALLRHLTMSGSCFVVATVRSGEPVPDAIVSTWKDGPLERIELQPLSEDETVELMHAALGGHVDASTMLRLWDASRGYPLYLRELVFGGIDAELLAPVQGVWRWRGASLATPRLTELVESRLGDLSRAERHVLEIVAQAEPLEADVLDALTERSDRESVERRGLLEVVVTDRRRTARMSHPLHAEAVRATTPPTTVSTTWQRLADSLAATGARRGGDLLRLATWRLDAGDRTDAELFVAAARQAITLQDFALAERLARAAVDADDRFETQFLLATALIGIGRGDEAEERLILVENVAENEEQCARAALRRSENLYGLGRIDAANDVVARAVDKVSTADWRDALMVGSARLRLFGGSDAEAAVAIVAELLDRPHIGVDVLLEAAPVATLGRIVTGRSRAASEFCDRLLPVAEQLAGGQHVMFASHWLRATRCAAALAQGQLTDAEHWARDLYQNATAAAAELRGVHGFILGWVRRVVGEPRSAVNVLEETVVVLREVDLYRSYAACCGELAHCHALIGDADAAEAAIAQAEAATVSSFVIDFSFIELARAWTAHARGELSRACQIVTDCAHRCASYGQLAFAAFAWHDLARLGAPQKAVTELATLATQMDGELVPAFTAHAAALAAGDAPGLDSAAAAFEQLGARLYAGEAAASAARRYREQGRTGSALTAAARAKRFADQCEGARTPALQALDASLPLTDREYEIAGLAARGLSNKQIAERLVISVRTVDNHLHNAYTKLGIAHRDQLATILLPEI